MRCNTGAPVLEATVKVQREATKDRTELYKGGKELTVSKDVKS